jgi:hypothetical protein
MAVPELTLHPRAVQRATPVAAALLLVGTLLFSAAAAQCRLLQRLATTDISPKHLWRRATEFRERLDRLGLTRKEAADRLGL